MLMIKLCNYQRVAFRDMPVLLFGVRLRYGSSVFFGGADVTRNTPWKREMNKDERVCSWVGMKKELTEFFRMIGFEPAISSLPKSDLTVGAPSPGRSCRANASTKGVQRLPSFQHA